MTRSRSRCSIGWAACASKGSGAACTVVNTAGFVATTHDISNSDFMAGRYNFSISSNPSASVVNQGSITAASGGFAATPPIIYAECTGVEPTLPV